MAQGYNLPQKFIDELLPSANGDYVKIFLYLYAFTLRGEAMPSYSAAAAALGQKESDVADCVSYFASRGFALEGEAAAPASVPDKSVYTPGEISDRLEGDSSLACLFGEVQSILDKTLSSAEMQTLFWIYDYLRLPADVVILLVNYCKKEGKPRLSYIEKQARSWADDGIDTLQKAAEHLDRLEQYRSYESHVKSLLGIGGRKLSTGEVNVIAKWESDLQPCDEMILAAYDICIDRTGKFSIKYINGILTKWKDKGIATLEDLQKEEQSPAKPGQDSYETFTNIKNLDYQQMELEALHKRIKAN